MQWLRGFSCVASVKPGVLFVPSKPLAKKVRREV